MLVNAVWFCQLKHCAWHSCCFPAVQNDKIDVYWIRSSNITTPSHSLYFYVQFLQSLSFWMLESGHALATSCSKETSAAAVTVKLTLLILIGCIILVTFPRWGVIGCISPLSASGTQWVNTETSCVGSDPRLGHASARRGADCETSV